MAKMTARCADKSKQTPTPPPKITWLSVDSIQPDVMVVSIERAISFQDFQLMWSWSTNVTDGQTDEQTTCDRKTALCTTVHRTVKIDKASECLMLHGLFSNLTWVIFLYCGYLVKCSITEIASYQSPLCQTSASRCLISSILLTHVSTHAATLSTL